MKRLVQGLLVSTLVLSFGIAPETRAGRAADVRTAAFKALNEGVTAYKKGDYAAAVGHLELSARVALNNFRAHFYLGLALIGDRRYPEALEVLEIALDLDPRHLQSNVAVGDAYLKMGDPNEAQAAYYRALRIRPEYPPALDGLARYYEARSEQEEAIAYYQRAIDSNRGYAPPYTHLGDLYLRQGRFEEAVMLLEEAVSVRPDYAPGLNRLALAYGRLGLDNQAVATIQKAIELEPYNAHHIATLGELQLEKGFLAAAVGSFEKSLQLDPSNAEARFGMAEVARRAGDYPAALDQIETAMADPRTDALMVSRLQKYRESVSSEAEQVVRLEAAVAAGEATREDYGALAEIFASRNLWADAAGFERQATPSAEQRERLAFLLFQAGRYGEAHEIYAELATAGNAGLALNNGVTLALLGDDAGAAAAYRQALAIEPDRREAQLYLANALLRLGDEGAAVESYKAYLDSDARGEAAERVRRILAQLAPEALVVDPPPPPRPEPDPPAADQASKGAS